MNLSICTAIWKRPELTRFVLDYYVQMDHDLIVAFSDYKDWWPEGALAVYADNEPLGAKWNAAVRTSQMFGADAVMIVGSDDLVSPDYIKHALRLIERGADVVQPAGCWFVELSSGEAFFHPIRTGAGRVVSRRLLELLDWKLWPDYATIRLDGEMDKVVATVPHRAIQSDVGRVVDLKSGENMWSYSNIWHMCGKPKLKTWVEALAPFGPMSRILDYPHFTNDLNITAL